MQKLKLLLLLPIAAFVLLSARCRHCDPVVPINLPFPKELKPYVDFGIGSYWVYQDSTTGKKDSVVLIDKKWGWDEASGMNDCKEYVVGKRVESLVLKYNVYRNDTFQRSYTIQSSNGNKLQTSINDTFTELDNSDGGYILSYPIERQAFEHSSGYRITQKFIDTITVNSIKYSNVLIIKAVLSGGIEFYSYYRYYQIKTGLILSLGRDTLNANGNYNRQLIRSKIL